ncbi:MAG: 2-hydroxyacyl-CoA dehydratase family protein [Deltaproteobacteria bacterium]
MIGKTENSGTSPDNPYYLPAQKVYSINATLDGILHSDWDDDGRRLYDLCRHIDKPRFNCFLHMPHGDGGFSYGYYANDLNRVIEQLEINFRVKASKENLWKAIDLYDQMRELLEQLYEMRKREIPPISGAEAIGIVMAAFFMPVELFTAELGSLMGYLDQRKCHLKQLRPRLLVISDRMDLMDYLQLVEDEGALVAMDDLDSGSRFFWGSTERNGDPVYALAKRQVSSPAEPCKWHFDKQIDRVIEWVKEYRIDGVLLLPHLGDTDRLCSLPFTLERLRSSNYWNGCGHIFYQGHLVVWRESSRQRSASSRVGKCRVRGKESNR